ncbi:hypothetical protein ES703_58119 [subsurface metagenome]
MPVEAGKTDNHILGVVLVGFKKLTIIYNGFNYLLHVIDFARVLGYDGVELRASTVRGVGWLFVGRIWLIIDTLGKVAQELFTALNTLGIAIINKVGYATLDIVHHSSTQLLVSDFLTHDCLDHIWTGNIHIA